MPNYTIEVRGLPTEAAPNDPGPLLASCELVDCPTDLIPDPSGTLDSMNIPLYGYNGVCIYVVNNPLHNP